MVTPEQAMAARVGDKFHIQIGSDCCTSDTPWFVRRPAELNPSGWRIPLESLSKHLYGITTYIHSTDASVWHRAEDCPRKEQA